MGTPFTSIYKRFLQKITDYKLLELSDEQVVEMMLGWLESAIAKCKELRADSLIYEYDDETDEYYFTHILSNLEREVLALGMVQEWLDPQIESVLVTTQFISGRQENFFAQHNHLNMLMNLQTKIKRERKQLISDYKTMHNSYLGTVEAVEEITDTTDDEGGG